MKNDNATKVTKVLIHKLHGGRKQDSKFWQSEFSEENRNKTPSNKPNKPNNHSSNIVSFFLYPIIFVAIILTGYVGYYGYKEYFTKPLYTPKVVSSREPVTPTVPTITQSKPKYSKPKRNRQTYSRSSENKLVTKKELDRAIQKALSKQSTPRKANTRRSSYRDPYYRVELTNGSVIKARSAIKDGTHYTIKDINGTEFALLRNDIKNVKKIFPEY